MMLHNASVTMNRLKRLGCVAGVVLLASGCQASTELVEDVATPTREPVAAVEPTAAVPSPTSTPVESLAPTATAVPVDSTPAPVPPTPTTAPTPVPTTAAIAEQDHSGLAGTRGLTLQWISWEPQDWGTVEFVPLVDGSYAVSGTQVGVDGDFVSVEGTMVLVNDRELMFTGEIVVQVSYTNEGQPCIRTGDIMFLATGDRRFWRMQDLLNCDGIVTDYVDIYFG